MNERSFENPQTRERATLIESARRPAGRGPSWTSRSAAAAG
jgi:hypothetical protein